MRLRNVCRLTPLMIGVVAAGSVHAQSSVTLYGLIDEGLDYTSNVQGKHAWEMQSGYLQGSRWGLRGREDLGGGNAALFVLENGFNVNTGKLGQGGREFGRQAYVGLSNNSLGSVTLGRQYDSVVDYLAATTSNGAWGGFIFSHPYDNDNTDNSFRISNSVKYTSPIIHGLQFGGLYGFSNTAGAFANNRAMSVGAKYTYGPLLFAASYMNIDNPGAGANGALTTDATFVAARQRVYGAGLTYTLGASAFGLSYSNASFSQPTATSYTSSSITPLTGKLTDLRFQNFEANWLLRLNPAFSLGAAYTYTLGDFDATSGTKAPKWHSVALTGDYSLSKRTDVYLQGAYQRTAGDRTGTVLDQAFIPGASNAASGDSQLLVRLAIRHKF